MKKRITLLLGIFTLAVINVFAQTNTTCNIQAYYSYTVDSSASNTIHFTNTTVNLLSSDTCIWTFGDSTTSRDVNPVHTYTTAASFNACLQVKRAMPTGVTPCSTQYCRTIAITLPCTFTLGNTWKADSITSQKIYFTGTSSLTDTAGVSAIWSFGDNTTATGWTATHTYAAAGKYNVCFRVASTTSCVKYACDSITVAANKTACNLQTYFISTVDSVNSAIIHCTNYTTNLLASDSTIWTFGDGTTSYQSSPSHTYAASGTYNICLTVKRVISGSSTPCTSQMCRTITVTVPCTFTIGNTSKADSITSQKIYFTGTSSLTDTAGVSATWSFGDNTTATGWTATHTYTTAGKYNVCFRVASTTSCVKYACDSVTVAANATTCNIKSYFISTVDSVNSAIIHCTNYTTNMLSSDSTIWTFGDGTTSYQSSPSHTYTTSGTYNICLTVKRVTNAFTTPCTSQMCRTITVTVPCNITAGYSYYYDSSATSDLKNYYFTNTSAAGSYDSSYWNFGDNTATDIAQNAMHVFTQAGTYNVCLKIMKKTPAGTAACISYSCQSIVVTTVCNVKPAFTWNVDSATMVSFTNTTPTTSAAATVTWFFGDGTSATSWNAVHKYSTAGKYYVCLRVQTSTSCIKYQCDSIVIAAPLPGCNQLSLFTYSHASTDNQLYTFAPYYLDPNVKYTWTFGDLYGSELTYISHRYKVAGTYTACLTAYRNDSCATTTCKSLVVTPQINCDSVQLAFNDYISGSAPNQVYLYTTLNSPLSQMSWTITGITNPADSAVLLQTSPVYVFKDTGYYNICLQAITVGGCLKTVCKTIHIDSIVAPCELYTYPNPVQSLATVNLQLGFPETISAYLYTAENALVAQVTQQGNIGNNVISFNMASLAAGFYTIKFIYGNNLCYAKFQKL